MNPLLGSLGLDIVAVIVCGFLGGFGLGLLHENGIELPHRRTVLEDNNSTPTPYLDFGFLADMFTGVLAALIVYALNPPASGVQLIGTSLVAGLGGAGILKGYVEARNNQLLAQIANEALDLAADQGGGTTLRTFGASEEPPVPSSPAPPAPTPDAAELRRIEALRRQVRELGY